MKTRKLLVKPLILFAGCLVSCALSLHAQTAPTITQQPTNQVAANAGTVMFGVAASGTAPFTYQWLFNGNNIAPFIITAAGNGSSSFSGDGGAATNASLAYPRGVAVDSVGNLFVADYENNRIRKAGTNGIITTLAGNGSYGFSGDGGAATNASLYYPYGVAVDNVGNLFIADSDNDRIREVGTNGIITTVAGNGNSGFSGDGGAATNTSLYYPYGVAVDSVGNLFIADSDNDRIREVSTNGIITTVAGNGSYGFSGDGGAATNASLYYPYGVAVDSVGNLFVADNDNERIREVGTNGIITTVAGNGSHGFYGDGNVATNASIYSPYGVAVDNLGNLFIADCYNDRIRQVSAWPASLSTLNLAGVTTNNIGAYSVIVSNVAGSVTSSVAALYMPVYIAVQPASQTALPADERHHHNPGRKWQPHVCR